LYLPYASAHIADKFGDPIHNIFNDSNVKELQDDIITDAEYRFNNGGAIDLIDKILVEREGVEFRERLSNSLWNFWKFHE